METTRTLRVQQKRWEAESVVSVTLTDPTGASLPSWSPGSHLALHLPNGLVREYSLCSNQQDRSAWTVAVHRSPTTRGGSGHVHDRLQVGDLITVEGPRNNFELDDTAREHVFVAGGIGITPILPMIRHLDSAEKSWRLMYLGRDRSAMALLGEIESLPAERVMVHADAEHAGARFDLADGLGSIAPDALVYACGPEPLMQACADILGDPARLRIERFRPPEVVRDEGADSGFDVVLASSGERISVAPDISVLDALTGAGVEVDSSCTEGICGTCEVAVVDGDVDHRDFVLSEEEHQAGKSMLVCVSRCRSAQLVLDL